MKEKIYPTVIHVNRHFSSCRKEAFQMLHLLARNENHQFMKERDLSAVRFVMLSQILQLKAVVEPDFNIKVFSKTS